MEALPFISLSMIHFLLRGVNGLDEVLLVGREIRVLLLADLGRCSQVGLIGRYLIGQLRNGGGLNVGTPFLDGGLEALDLSLSFRMPQRSLTSLLLWLWGWRPAKSEMT